MSFFILVGSYAFVAVALPLCAYLGYLAFLAFEKRNMSYGEAQTQFAIVVPSHNEQDNIEATIESLGAVDYPESMRKIIVVADNCIDQTAEVARRSGAIVWERVDDLDKGKGYALHFAFDKILQDGNYGAVVVVDADTVVSKNLLRSFDARLTNGEHAIQAEYGVRNVHSSWRTKLMAIALGMFHRTRFLARERLGVSVGLRGNGMCFSTELLVKQPHTAFSVVEDVEYGIKIGLAGIRVAFAQDAKVLGEMVSSAKDSVSQRQRWEGGRLLLVKKYLPSLLKSAIKNQSALHWDLSLDIIVPPLSYIVVLTTIGVLLEATLVFIFNEIHISLYLWSAAIMGLVLYILRGVQHSGLGLYGIVVLMYAPFYVMWKILIARPFGAKGTTAWVRTKRENEESTDSSEHMP